jgi:hypothetical protein
MIFYKPHTKHSPASAAVLPATEVKEEVLLITNMSEEIHVTN